MEETDVFSVTAAGLCVELGSGVGPGLVTCPLVTGCHHYGQCGLRGRLCARFAPGPRT